MRIDLPLCNLKYCRLCHDGNCWDKPKFERCEYTKLKQQLEAYEGTGLEPEEIKALQAENERLRSLVDEIESTIRRD